MNVDIPALQAKGLSPVDVINAISSQNLALPAGTVKMGPTEYNVEMNGSHRHDRRAQRPAHQDSQRRHHLRARRGPRQRRLFAADQYRAHGRPARRAGDASTRTATPPRSTSSSRPTPRFPQMAASLPPQLVITPIFDQSIFVRAASAGRDSRGPDRGLPDRR